MEKICVLTWLLQEGEQNAFYVYIYSLDRFPLSVSLVCCSYRISYTYIVGFDIVVVVVAVIVVMKNFANRFILRSVMTLLL